MNELLEVADTWKEWHESGQIAWLATVVRVEGSSFRRPGARMLIGQDGRAIGSVSGGCLEADVITRALSRGVMVGPELVTYDSTVDSDIIFGTGMGCRGKIDILIEPLRQADSAELAVLSSAVRSRRPAVAATIVRAADDRVEWVGRRLVVDREGLVSSQEMPEPLTECLVAQARATLDGGRSESVDFEVAGTDVSAFFEYVQPPPSLVVFGGGVDAVALARIAHSLGWPAHVLDHRPAYANPARFPKSTQVVLVDNESGGPVPALTADTFAVLMTHSYLRDKAALHRLIVSPAPYIGILGPKRRTNEILDDLRTEGLRIGLEEAARLYGPAGLDIGATTPDEIALAVAAEIQAVRAARQSAHLRDRQGPIYS